MAESTGAVEVKLLPLNSKCLSGNPLGDPSRREIGICLPPNYGASAKRYPVALMLSGFGSSSLGMLNRVPFGESLPERLARLYQQGLVQEMILVLPDCFSRYGGTQYVDSPAIGNYESFLTEEVVPFVDQNFRTLPDRKARAVVGKSSGGYGALRLIRRRPDLFSVVAAHAPDAVFEYSYQKDFPAALLAFAQHGGTEPFVRWFERLPAKPGSAFTPLSIICCAAAWSPSSSGPYGFGTGFDLPFDLETGEIDQPVWQRWKAEDPTSWLSRVDAREAFSASSVYLDVGFRDEYNLQFGARQIAKQMTAYNIARVYEEFDGGHTNTAFRYDHSLAFVSQHLAKQ